MVADALTILASALQLVERTKLKIFLGIEGVSTNSTKNLFNFVLSTSCNALAEIVRASATMFFLLGMDFMFKYLKSSSKSDTLFL